MTNKKYFTFVVEYDEGSCPPEDVTFSAPCLNGTLVGAASHDLMHVVEIAENGLENMDTYEAKTIINDMEHYVKTGDRVVFDDE